MKLILSRLNNSETEEKSGSIRPSCSYLSGPRLPQCGQVLPEMADLPSENFPLPSHLLSCGSGERGAAPPNPVMPQAHSSAARLAQVLFQKAEARQTN